MKGRIVAGSVVWLVACDSGVPPRSQADTRVQGASAVGIGQQAQGTSTHSPAWSQSSAFNEVGASVDVAPPSHTSPALFEPDRACQTHADCAIVPDDCRECPPCEAVWRSAANHATVRRIVEARAAVECPPIYCEQCWTPPPPGAAPAPQGYLGDAAECRAGQCVVKGQ